MPFPTNSFIFKRTGTIVPNRAVLAAMTNKQSHSDGTISDEEISWLSRRSEGSFGIITTAASHVSKDGQGWEGEIGVFDDKHIERLSILTGLIHKQKSLIFAQLFHGGMRSPQILTGKQPISASKIKSKMSKNGYTRSASVRDIKKIINDFTLAAVRCENSGFDGIELHGAHGYLISQFLGINTNLRKDKWGGSIEKRSKFLIEIYRSIKEKVSDSLLVGVRISPEIDDIGINLDDALFLSRLLRDEGVDFIHLSCWDVYSRSKQHPDNPKTLTEWFTQSIKNLPPIISTGNVWSRSDAQHLIDQGADLVGVARAGIAYPDWAKNLSKNNYDPSRGPFSIKHLKKAGLSDIFIDYMRNWKNFVK